MPTPAADLPVDAALVRRLLAEQAPDLSDRRLRLVANGWDNAVLRLGDDLAVRVPRRLAAAELIRHEQLTLPEVAARVPVAVPAPVRIGLPSAAFPWHWSVVPWFDGRTVAVAGLRSDRRLAGTLGRFLTALHRPTTSPSWNPVRGVPLRDRAEAVAERLDSGSVPRADEVAARWADAIAAPGWDGPPMLLHGDLHPANLIERDGRLVAVVDFGDTTAGDPATDLATAWLTFDAGARAVLRELLEPDDATWRRARGWAIGLATAMVTTAEPGSPIHTIGSDAIEQVLAER